jgi:apolipoprotein N-acyltransferase
MAVILINGTIASIAERVLAPWQACRRRRKLILEGGEVALDASVEPSRPFPPLTRGFETVLPLLLLVALARAAAPSAEPLAGTGPVLRVGLLQRNFPCVFKGPEADPMAEYARLLGAVAPLAPDLLVLPESALCEIGRIGTARAAQFAAWACEKTGAKALLAGGSRRDGDKEFNSAALYAGSAAPQVYDKVHLVPFGEFIPGDKLIPALQKLAPVGSCTPGELKLLTVGGVKIGVAICFEDTDSAQMRRLAALGAQALVFITNDSWFSYSDEALQHSWQAVARAIETGLTVIRVGNNGVTGVIRPDGNISWLTGSDARPLVDKSSAMFDRIAIAGAGERPELSWYVRLGDIPLATLFILLIATMILVKYRISYEKRRNMSM